MTVFSFLEGMGQSHKAFAFPISPAASLWSWHVLIHLFHSYSQRGEQAPSGGTACLKGGDGLNKWLAPLSSIWIYRHWKVYSETHPSASSIWDTASSLKEVCIAELAIELLWSDSEPPYRSCESSTGCERCACKTELFIAEVKTMRLQHRIVHCWCTCNRELLIVEAVHASLWSSWTTVQIQVLYRLWMMQLHHGTVMLQTVHVLLWSN